MKGNLDAIGPRATQAPEIGKLKKSAIERSSPAFERDRRRRKKKRVSTKAQKNLLTDADTR